MRRKHSGWPTNTASSWPFHKRTIPFCSINGAGFAPAVMLPFKLEASASSLGRTEGTGVHRSAGAPFLIAQKGGKDGVGIDCISFASPQSGKAHTFRHASFHTRSVCFEFGRTEGIGVRRSAGAPFLPVQKRGKDTQGGGAFYKAAPPPCPPPYVTRMPLRPYRCARCSATIAPAGRQC